MENITIEIGDGLTLETNLSGIDSLIDTLQRLGRISEEDAGLARQLQDAFDNQATAVDVSKIAFDGLLGGINGLVGGLNAAKAANEMLGISTEGLATAMEDVARVQTLVKGVQEAYTEVGKKGAMMQGIMAIQAAAAARATALQGQATLGATIAQAAFNLVAKANPYVLLAGAIITVVGAVAAWQWGTKSMREEQERLNKQMELNDKVFSGSSSSVGDQREAFEELRMKWAECNGDLEKQKKLVEDSKDTFANLGVEVNNVGEAENVLVTNAPAYIEAMQKKAESMAAAKVAAEQYAEGFRKIATAGTIDLSFWEKLGIISKNIATSSVWSIPADYVNALDEKQALQKTAGENMIKTGYDLTKRSLDAEKEGSKQLEDANIKSFNEKEIAMRKAEKAAAYKLTELRLSAQKDGFMRLANDRDADTTERLEAARKAYDKELALIRLGTAKALEAEKLGPNQKTAIWSEAHNKEAEALIKQNELVKGIVEDGVNKRLAVIKRGAELQAVAQSECEQKELLQLSENYALGKSNLEEYEKAKADIRRWYATQALNDEISSLEAQLGAGNLSDEKELELKDQLNAKQSELRKMNAANAIANNEEMGNKLLSDTEQLDADIAKMEEERIQEDLDRLKEEAEKKKEVMDALKSGAMDLFNSITDSIFEGQKAALQQQLDDLDKFYTTDAEKAKENGNLKLISEEELEKKKKDIKQQQAQVDKNQAIFKATIGALTSAAQVAWNPVLAAIVLAFGMAQVAMIAAKPLPKLWKGRSGGPGQMAMVGEQGPEVVYVPQGASVVPAHQSRVLKEAARIAERYRMPNPAAGLALTKEAAAAGKLTLALPGATMDYDRLGRTIAQNIPKADQVSINMDENGFTKHLTRGNSRVRVLGGRY